MKIYPPARYFGTSAKLSSHYETLGITRDATQAEVKAAYYKRSMELHPDKITGNREQFEKVANAYKVLSDARLRKIHNQMTESEQHGRMHRKDSKTKTHFSSTPPVFDFDAWMRHHHGTRAFHQRMEETKNRIILRQMKSDVTERENVVIGVLVSVLLLFGYTSIKSIREDGAPLDNILGKIERKTP